jgi:phosphatidate cytidylyltransferase
MSAQEKVGGRRDGVLVRVLSALVLAPLAITFAYVGGWPFILFWTLAAVGVYWEWSAEILQAGRPLQVAGGLALAISGGLALAQHPVWAIGVIAAGAAAFAAFRSRETIWCAGGLLYAGVVLAGPMLLRRDPHFGALALFFLFAVVWTTDILAFYGGRMLGGPKLAPAVSPKKTWSGALVGAAGGTLAGVVIALTGFTMNPLAAAGLALLMSVVAQAGDLVESALKRRFGVKDSSRIIPGHGGLMDRLDGFLAAAGAAALLGVARGGLDGAGGGLFVW